MALFNVNSDNFDDEVLASNEPVLVDFFANWCMPCKMLSPVIDEIANDMKVCKVDVDESEDIAREYFVVSIPTLVAFKNGEEIGRINGNVPKDEILALFS